MHQRHPRWHTPLARYHPLHLDVMANTRVVYISTIPGLKLGTKVRGTLSGLTGAIHVAEKPEASWVEVTVDASSVDTRNEPRDEHLRSADFLHVEKFPTMTFRSTKLELAG